jgi:excisionase family DNA binding protein
MKTGKNKDMSLKLATKPDGRLRQFLTQQQVAQALQVDVRTVRSLINRKELTAVIFAAKLRIPVEELERYLQRMRIGRPFQPNTHPQRDEEESGDA